MFTICLAAIGENWELTMIKIAGKWDENKTKPYYLDILSKDDIVP